jgi:hypothetical protein
MKAATPSVPSRPRRSGEVLVSEAVGQDRDEQLLSFVTAGEDRAGWRQTGVSDRGQQAGCV